MTTTPHPPDVKMHKTRFWWIFMSCAGGLSLLFNLWAVFEKHQDVSTGKAVATLILGLIAHACPVGLSAGASHGFNTDLLGRGARRVIIGLFLLFMAMSVTTQAELMQKTVDLDLVWAWSLPLGIDAVALLCLRAILNAHKLNAEAAEARDEAALRAAVALDITPDIREDMRREFEATLPARERDIALAILRDMWAVKGRDIPAEYGVDIPRHMSALEAVCEEDILNRHAERFEADNRAMAQRWKAERIEVEEDARQKEREAALERWNDQKEALTKEIRYALLKELAPGKGSATGRPAITSGSTSTKRLTTDEAKDIVRQSIQSGDGATNAELAEMIGRDRKTVSRYRAEIRADLGLADEDDDDETPGLGRLRAV